MTKITLFIVALILGCLVAQPVKSVQASSYVVTAAIPYAAPTNPSTVGPTFNKLTSTKDSLQVSGTCQINSPASVVSVWKGSASLGSTSCQANGTFSLTISLVKGVNNLRIRTSSLSNLYGPDSSPFQITYSPATTNDGQQPVTPPDEPASNTSNPPAASGSAAPLSVRSTRVFEALDASNKVTVHIQVSGGQKPYAIEMNWGDGSIDKKTVATPGTYTFSHAYEKSGSYQAMAIVTDVLGVRTTHQFLISALNPPESSTADDNGNSSTTKSRHPSKRNQAVAIGVVSVLAVGGIGAMGYFLGQNNMYNSLKSKPTNNRALKTRAKPRGKK